MNYLFTELSTKSNKEESISAKKARPFVKWIGGKTQSLKEIQAYFPTDRNSEFTYVEPFVGGGAVLFWVLSTYPKVQAIICDVNADLINSYISIRDEIQTVLKELLILEAEFLNNKSEQSPFYYQKRTLFNSRISAKPKQTALFIFLNKTCFNGLYRVNRKNEFNASLGTWKTITICDVDNLKKVSVVLQKVTILCGDFEQTKQYNTPTSFFYLDPPYKPVSKTANFVSYAKGRFSDQDQKRTKEFCDSIGKSGCSWLVSNSAAVTEQGDLFFGELFSGYHIQKIDSRRVINTTSTKRGKIKELLISNNF